jgi:plasmid replication initiation protein
MSKCYLGDYNGENLTVNRDLPSTIQDFGIWKNNFFKQSNYLVEAVFEQSFKEFELKVLGLVSKHISKSNLLPLDKTGRLIEISISKYDFCNSLNIDLQNFYQQAKSLTPDLHKKSIFLERQKSPDKSNRSKKEFLSVVLIPQIACKDNQITFWISPILQPYLQKLRVEYTLLSLEYISKMGSSYAIKLYQLLAQYQNLKKRVFSILGLKKIFGISNKYRDFTRFKEEVIQVAIKHINENSNLRITFEIEKSGKKVENIIFKIALQETQLQQAVLAFTNEIEQILQTQNNFYTGSHEELRKNWRKSKKDIKQHTKLFHEWLEKRTIDYKAHSMDPLHLKENKNWYTNFLKKEFERAVQKSNY